MNNLLDIMKRWPTALQIVVILCCFVSLDLALLALVLLVITSPTAGAGAIMSLLSLVQLVLSRRRRPSPRRPKPRQPKPP